MIKAAARSYQEFWDNQETAPKVLLYRAAYKWAMSTGAYKRVSEEQGNQCATILKAYLTNGAS